jgi:hypothetical protein
MVVKRRGVVGTDSIDAIGYKSSLPLGIACKTEVDEEQGGDECPSPFAQWRLHKRLIGWESDLFKNLNQRLQGSGGAIG